LLKLNAVGILTVVPFTEKGNGGGARDKDRKRVTFCFWSFETGSHYIVHTHLELSPSVLKASCPQR
jgi:hypothetical protein